MTIRPAQRAELDTLNQIVTAAVMGWPVSDRVKRTSLPILRYDAMDMDELEFLVAEERGEIAGLAAWDATTSLRGPDGLTGALLHGLYVQPERQAEGIGRTLQNAVVRQAAERGFDGVLVKAERPSASYFAAQGYQHLPESRELGLQYPYLYWRRSDREAGLR